MNCFYSMLVIKPNESEDRGKLLSYLNSGYAIEERFEFKEYGRDFIAYILRSPYYKEEKVNESNCGAVSGDNSSDISATLFRL